MLSSHVEALEVKHARLEQAIHAEMNRPAPNDTTLAELKRKKLKIKEELSHI